MSTMQSATPQQCFGYGRWNVLIIVAIAMMTCTSSVASAADQPFSGPYVTSQRTHNNRMLQPYTIDTTNCDPLPVQPRTPQSTDVPAYAHSLSGALSGELMVWHKLTVGFTGPEVCERAIPNPFSDFRLDVTFSHVSTGTEFTVPGYYAADGNAANTGANGGPVWLVHFSPNLVGEWEWEATFRYGDLIAQDVGNPGGVSAGFFDGATGTFSVAETDKTGGRDLRGKGLLEYVGEHHLRFAGNGEWFLKAGADSPENFLAFEGFDDTPNITGYLKTWEPHEQDYNVGDPTWAGGIGLGIIGAVNYLSEQGMNAFSFLTFNIEGDDKNVFPFVTDLPGDDRLRYDVSKLAQWEVVFEHGDRMGMFLHFKTQEKENDLLMDYGELGYVRTLYYRELIARFGHHLALTWNLGEEITVSHNQLSQYIHYFKQSDPYQHPLVVHTFPTYSEYDRVYDPLLGNSDFNGPSLQVHRSKVFEFSLDYVTRSSEVGHKWIVSNDEQGPGTTGVLPDSDDANHNIIRRSVLWGNIMAGGAGVEYYFGYLYAHSDLTCEDFRSRANMWQQSLYALEFFSNNRIPFWDMSNCDGLLVGDNSENHCLKQTNNEVILVFLGKGGTQNLNLPGTTSDIYEVSWYATRYGGNLQFGSVTTLQGGSQQSLGTAPQFTSHDWLVVLQVQESPTPSASPSISLVPSNLVSNSPSSLPTTFPSDARSDFPSALPLSVRNADASEVPSALPSRPLYASAEASTLPTPQVSDVPSARPTSFHSFAPTTIALAVEAAIRINCGVNDATMDSAGNIWEPERGSNGVGTQTCRTTSVEGTSDPDLFRCYRQDDHRSDPQVAYEIEVPADGQYRIQLYFYYNSRKGQLGDVEFAIELEGQVVDPSFDIVEAGGGMPQVAIVRSYDMEVTDGAVSLQLLATTGKARISAIAIFSL